MESKYELKLTNTTRLLVVLPVGMVAILLLAGGGAKLLSYYNESIASSAFLLLFVAGFYALYRLAKTWGSEAIVIRLKSDTLLMLNRRSSKETQISFDTILAYQFTAFNGGEVLCIKLKDGGKLKLATSTTFHSGQDFVGMVREFEVLLSVHQQKAGSQATLREKSFFEKPISTAVLIVFATAVAAVVWQVAVNHKSVSGGFFTSCGFFISYLAAWLASHERRKQA